jgi:hypothetical protein
MIWTSPACKALDISWPVASTLSFRSTPCLRKIPFSTPTKLGTWFMLLPTAAVSTGGCCAAGVPARRAAATIATTTLPNLFIVGLLSTRPRQDVALRTSHREERRGMVPLIGSATSVSIRPL